MKTNRTFKRAPAATVAALLFYFTAFVCEYYNVVAKWFPKFAQADASGWFLSHGYRVPLVPDENGKMVAAMTGKIWVWLFCGELSLVFIGLIMVISIFTISHVLRRNKACISEEVQTTVHYLKTVALGILLWMLLDLATWLYNYKTEYYFVVYILLEIALFVMRELIFNFIEKED